MIKGTKHKTPHYAVFCRLLLVQNILNSMLSNSLSLFCTSMWKTTFHTHTVQHLKF